MMTLSEHLAAQEDLEERVLRIGTIVAYGSKSRRGGDDAVQALKQRQQALQMGGTNVDVEGH